MMWNPDDFLKHLYDSQSRAHSFKASTFKEWEQWRIALKEVLIQALALPDRKNLELEPLLLDRVDCGEYFREHIQLTTDSHLKMPIYLLIPKTGKSPSPAIIACPGHGYGYKQLIGLLPDGSARSEGPGIY